MQYYLSTYYGREQLALRLPFFISASPIATAVGSLLATAYTDAGRISGLPWVWSNIFLINACITFAVSIGSYFILPTRPSETTYLSTKERRYIMARSKRLTAGSEKEENSKVSLGLRALRTPSVYFTLFPW
jgi:MFS family permease